MENIEQILKFLDLKPVNDHDKSHIYLLLDPSGKILLYNVIFAQLCNIANIENKLLNDQTDISNYFYCKDLEFDKIFRDSRHNNKWEGELYFNISFDKILSLRTEIYSLTNHSEECGFFVNIVLDNYGIFSNDDYPNKSNKKKNELSALITGFNKEQEFLTSKKRDDIISTISHEFRTPLTAIMGFAETIKADKDMDDVIKEEFLEIIINESKKITALVNDMIDLLVYEKGMSGFIKDPQNLKTIINYVSNIYKSRIDIKQLKLYLDLPENPGMVSVNYEKIVQLISYLLDNAIKFSNTGGVIIIKYFEEEKDIHISVKNNGPVINPEEIKNIFKRYYKIDKTNLKIRGLGIGLSICYQIIELHNGKIWVESNEKDGTTFNITLPKE